MAKAQNESPPRAREAFTKEITRNCNGHHSATSSSVTPPPGDPLALAVAAKEGKNAAKWRQTSILWEDVLAWLEKPASYKEGRGYVFGELADGKRTKETVISRSALTLDVDHPKADFLDRLKGVLGWHIVVIHTTYSSTGEKPRLRLIIPLADPVTETEYRAAVGELMRRVSPDGGEFDPGSSQPERFMYPPSVQDGEEFWFEVWEGDRLNASVLADAGRERVKAYEAAPVPTTMGKPDDGKAYFLQAVSGEETLLAFHSEGSRNDALNRAAFKLGQLAHLCPEDSEDDPENIAREAMHGACQENGVLDDEGEGEFNRTFGNGWRDGKRHPRGVKAAPTSGDVADAWERSVTAELERLQIREEARRRFNALSRVAPPMPDAVGLDALLMMKLDAPRWRIDGLWPADARVNLVATAKAGKTTTTANLVRSLADGGDFLSHSVRPLGAGQTVAIFDTEMTEVQLQGWYSDLGLENPGKVRIVSIMGRAAGLNFVDEDTLRGLVERYAGAHTYILDPIGPVLSGLGLDENSNTDVQRFLSAWDTFVTLMGGRESVIVHHAGHAAERARGASAFLGSGSAIWTLTTDDPNDPDTQRYFRAMGRDVNVPSTPLTYDPFSRRLSLGQVSKYRMERENIFHRLWGPILEVVTGKPGLSVGKIETLVRENGVSFRKGDAGKALEVAIERGLLDRVQDGPNKRHYLPGEAPE